MYPVVYSPPAVLALLQLRSSTLENPRSPCTPVIICCGCHFLQIPSDKVPFNEKPDMKAYEITEAGKEAMRSGKYQMVGHASAMTALPAKSLTTPCLVDTCTAAVRPVVHACTVVLSAADQ